MTKVKQASAVLSILIISNTGKINAEENVTKLEEVVVSATRSELPKKRVTQSVTVINHQEIEQQQVTDLHEVLRDVPGVSVTQTGSRGAPNVTIFIRGGNADHNLVLMDGVRVNQAGGFFDFAQIPTDNIERVEILKGPQGALYGSDAITSVIHIITKKGAGKTKTNFSLAAGNWGTFEERINVSGGLGNGGFSVGASRIDTEGILPINNRFGETGFSSRLDQKLYDQIDFSLTARYVDAKVQFPTENGGDRLQPMDPRQYNKRRRLNLSSQMEASPWSWWNHKLQLGLQEEDRITFDPRDPLVDSAESHSLNTEVRHSLDYLWNFNLPETAEVKTVFTAGIALEREMLDQLTRRVTVSTTATGLDQSRNNYAYLFQGQWNWKDMVFIIPGVRVEENETYGTEPNPRITAGFLLPWTKTKVRGSYAQGIKEPSFLQNFGSAQIIPNLNLKPERVKSWEIGIDQYILEQFIEVTVTYFNNQYKDLIAFRSTAFPFQNIQKAESSGVESSIKFTQELPKNFNLGLNFSHTYLETKALEEGGFGGTGFTPGEPLLRRPKHRGAATVNMAHPRFNVNLNTTVQGETLDRDFSVTPEKRVILPAYAKTDLSASVIAWEKFSELKIFTKIENLFNAKYEEVFGFSTARLKFLAGLALTF